MYCSSCGNAVAEGLLYCSRCGTQTSPPREERIARRRGPSPDALVWALVAIIVGGFGVLTGLASVLKSELGLSTGVIAMLVILGVVLLVSTGAAFIWLLLRSMVEDGMRRLNIQPARPTNELQGASDRALSAGAETIDAASTKRFEPAGRDRT